MKKIEESTIKNNALERSEDDFGCMLYLLEQLNNSVPYYKTMLKA